jgi:hypothetical protein
VLFSSRNKLSAVLLRLASLFRHLPPSLRYRNLVAYSVQSLDPFDEFREEKERRRRNGMDVLSIKECEGVVGGDEIPFMGVGTRKMGHEIGGENEEEKSMWNTVQNNQ